MQDTPALPRLDTLYSLKNSVLRAICEQGRDSIVSAEDAADLGLSGTFTLATLLAAVEKMIEAMASLRDFSKEPLSEEEQKDLEDIWQLEEALVTASQIELATGQSPE